MLCIVSSPLYSPKAVPQIEGHLSTVITVYKQCHIIIHINKCAIILHHDCKTVTYICHKCVTLGRKRSESLGESELDQPDTQANTLVTLIDAG